MTGKAGSLLNPDTWGKARAILDGEDKERCTVKSAARAAGVSVREFNAWVKRSRERLEDDEPWVWEIAEVVDGAGMSQAATLEEVLWSQVMRGRAKEVWFKGEKVGVERINDPNVAFRLLQARDSRYVEKREQTNRNVNLNVDLEKLEKQWRAYNRMEEVKKETALPNKVEDAEIIDMDKLLDEIKVEK